MAYGRRYPSKSAGSGEGGTVKKKWNGYKRPPVIIRGSAYKPILHPTDEQVAIFDHVRDSDNSLNVSAYAGVGKTTSAVESMQALLGKKSIQYLVFNTRNAREAEGKCEERIAVNTCHSFAFRAYVAAMGKVEISKTDKDENIARALIGGEDDKIDLRHYLTQAVELAKNYLAEDNATVREIVARHAIDTCDMNDEEFASNVLKAMDLAVKQDRIVSFTDMLFCCYKKNIRVPQADVTYVDEDQDLSNLRLELAMRSMRPGGKMVSLGDIFQQCYLFTGANSKAVENIIQRTNADTKKLTITFRCGKKIVDLARSYVSDYIAADSNPDGVVANMSYGDMMQDTSDGGAGPGDFVLSRTNAPLASIAMQFLKQGRKVSIMGKDLGASLAYMVKRSKATTVVQFLGWLDDWRALECEKLIARNKDCEQITDRFECLINFCDGTNDPKEVIKRINTMFTSEDEEQNDRIVLATLHKSKGNEKDRVWFLEDTCKVRAKTEEDIQVEKNLRYIGITRAKTHLFLTNKD